MGDAGATPAQDANGADIGDYQEMDFDYLKASDLDLDRSPGGGSGGMMPLRQCSRVRNGVQCKQPTTSKYCAQHTCSCGNEKSSAQTNCGCRAKIKTEMRSGINVEIRYEGEVDVTGSREGTEERSHLRESVEREEREREEDRIRRETELAEARLRKSRAEEELRQAREKKLEAEAELLAEMERVRQERERERDRLARERSTDHVMTNIFGETDIDDSLVEEACTHNRNGVWCQMRVIPGSRFCRKHTCPKCGGEKDSTAGDCGRHTVMGADRAACVHRSNGVYCKRPCYTGSFCPHHTCPLCGKEKSSVRNVCGNHPEHPSTPLRPTMRPSGSSVVETTEVTETTVTNIVSEQYSEYWTRVAAANAAGQDGLARAEGTADGGSAMVQYANVDDSGKYVGGGYTTAYAVPEPAGQPAPAGGSYYGGLESATPRYSVVGGLEAGSVAVGSYYGELPPAQYRPLPPSAPVQQVGLPPPGPAPGGPGMVAFGAYVYPGLIPVAPLAPGRQPECASSKCRQRVEVAGSAFCHRHRCIVCGGLRVPHDEVCATCRALKHRMFGGDHSHHHVQHAHHDTAIPHYHRHHHR